MMSVLCFIFFITMTSSNRYGVILLILYLKTIVNIFRGIIGSIILTMSWRLFVTERVQLNQSTTKNNDLKAALKVVF